MLSRLKVPQHGIKMPLNKSIIGCVMSDADGRQIEILLKKPPGQPRSIWCFDDGVGDCPVNLLYSVN